MQLIIIKTLNKNIMGAILPIMPYKELDKNEDIPKIIHDGLPP